MRHVSILIRFALILACCAGLIDQAWAQPMAAQRVTVELKPQAQAVPPGHLFGLAVVLDIQEGWHIVPGEGSGDESPDLIATRIDLDLPDGWLTGPIQWPTAHEIDVEYSGFRETIKAYEGRSVAFIPVRVPRDAELGDATLRASVRYQACNDQTCEMPRTTEATAAIRVAPDADPVDADVDLFAGFTAPPGANRAVDDGRVHPQLIWQQSRIEPGQTVGLAVAMPMDDGWHIQVGDDAGEEVYAYATVLEVLLPPGWSRGPTQWPESHRIKFGTADFAEEILVYEDGAVAHVPVTVPGNAEPGTYRVEALLHYQACDDEMCEMPETAWAAATIEVVPEGQAGEPDPAAAAIFEDYGREPDRDGAPPSSPAGEEAGHSGADASPLKLAHAHIWLTLVFVWLAMTWMIARTFAITPKWSWRLGVAAFGLLVMAGWWNVTRGLTEESAIDWIPYSATAFDEAIASGDRTVVVEFTAEWCFNCKVLERTTLSDPEVIAALGAPNVTTFRVDLTGENPEGMAHKEELGGGGIPLTAVYRPGEEPVSLRGHYFPETILAALTGESAAAVNDFSFLGFDFSLGTGAWILVFGIAFLAGFLMNFTPCVLPVIPIKILSLQAHASNRAKCLALGVLFGLGMVALFAAIGVPVAILRAQFDWGSWWSKWPVTGALGLIMLAMGLGMLGLFAMRLPNFVYMFNPQSDTYAGSFFMGVFAAVLSTPCTGPLFGATIAWVVTQPAWIILATFLAMGLGMAFPYVLLTAKPSWLDRMPRTGPGSELVKQVMGLLIIAVAVYFLGTAVIGFNASTSSAADQVALVDSHSERNSP